VKASENLNKAKNKLDQAGVTAFFSKAATTIGEKGG
jgi:hypothetical protein